jgi:hypothetical protein
MARKPTGNPIGPPKKEISWEVFEQLCAIQCTQSEICSVLKIHDDTLRVRCLEQYGEEYSAIYKRYSESGKSSLRRYQFMQAKTKPAMAIWLGKQWLKQTDTIVTETPKNDQLLNQILENIKTPSFSETILDLTKANASLQDQVNALQKQLQETLDVRENDAGLRTDPEVL